MRTFIVEMAIYNKNTKESIKDTDLGIDIIKNILNMDLKNSFPGNEIKILDVKIGAKPVKANDSLDEIRNKINKISDKDKTWRNHLLRDLNSFKEKGYIRNGDIFITDIDTAKKYLNDGINMIGDKNINFDKYESGLTPEEIEDKIKNKRRNKTMANTEEKGYQGWKNYESWAVKLHIDNEQGSQEMSRDLVMNVRVEDKDEWRRDGADVLKEWLEDEMPDLGATMWADLLNGAWSEVDWYEISENIIDEILENEKYEADKNLKDKEL
jgi:soluble cytochrome b562